MKKGQVTIFVIIGLVLLLGGLLFYSSTLQHATKTEERQNIEPQLVPQIISQHLTSCVNEQEITLIKKISYQGGVLELEDKRVYRGVAYNYLCSQQPQYGCVNNLITRQSIEAQLNSELKDLVAKCINLSYLRKQGYQISEVPLTISTTVSVNDVEIVVSYPVEITKQEFSVKNPSQSVKLFLPLGKLLDLATIIVNDEIGNNYFDKDKWMNQHHDVEIEKHRPYPDIVYSLKTYIKETKDSLQFNFAVQGKDTVSVIGQPAPQLRSYGYCVMPDANCYYNSINSKCIGANGKWQDTKPTDCKGPTKFEQLICTDCLDCGIRKNGESWCEYAGIAGLGLDFVGTRHYLKSCINGKIFSEECRDFREELCAEEMINGLSKAVCRPNRWQICSGITNQKDCEDVSKADCKWYAWLNGTLTFGVKRKDHLCAPIVPPGFRHWVNNGAIVCGMASEQRTCDGISCPQRWVDTTAEYCYYQGDCGNYYNFAPDLTTLGYVNTDTNPRIVIYPKAATINETFAPLNLSQELHSQPILTSHEFDNKIPVEKLLKGISDYLAWLSRQKPSDYVMEYLRDGAITFHVVHTAFCFPWSAPYGGNKCYICNKSLDRPCTEYSCKSLGQNCEYQEQNGFGRCMARTQVAATEGPSLKFDSRFLPAGYTATQEYFSGYENCWLIRPEVKPYTTITFGFNTSEEAICKLAALPLNYSLIPSFSVSNFNRTHQMSVKVITTEQLKDQLLTSIGVNTIIELGMLPHYKDLFDKYKDKILKIASRLGKSTYTSTLIAKLETQFYGTIQPSVANIINLVESLVIDIENRHGVVFVKCIDKSGNQNKEEFCFRYAISEDKEQPEVMKVEPQNKSTAEKGKLNFTVTLNEPAECKYSVNLDFTFDSMKDWMDCEISELAGVFSDYQCSAEVEMNGPAILFVRCKDQPQMIRTFILNLEKGNRFKVEHEDITGVIKLAAPNTINITNSYILENNETVIMVNDTSNGLNAVLILNLDEPMKCVFSKKDEKFDDIKDEAQCGQTNPYCNIFIPNLAGKETVYIKCKSIKTVSRNTNTKSYVISYGLSR